MGTSDAAERSLYQGLIKLAADARLKAAANVTEMLMTAHMPLIDLLPEAPQIR